MYTQLIDICQIEFNPVCGAFKLPNIEDCEERFSSTVLVMVKLWPVAVIVKQKGNKEKSVART